MHIAVPTAILKRYSVELGKSRRETHTKLTPKIYGSEEDQQKHLEKATGKISDKMRFTATLKVEKNKESFVKLDRR